MEDAAKAMTPENWSSVINSLCTAINNISPEDLAIFVQTVDDSVDNLVATIVEFKFLGAIDKITNWFDAHPFIANFATNLLSGGKTNYEGDP
jgi:hypothetical protein